MMENTELEKQFALGFVVTLGVIFIAYLAVSIYQLGYMEGETHASQKREIKVYNFSEHRNRSRSREAAETGSSDSVELRASPETKE